MAIDWTALRNWASYMQEQNAFGPATTYAQGFCKQWAPLVHKIANENYNPTPADLENFASATYEYGVGILGNFFTYWYASPSTYCLMCYPGSENNPAGYAPADWGLQGMVIRNVPPRQSTDQFEKAPDETTNYATAMMNNLGVSPIDRGAFCQENGGIQPNSQLGLYESPTYGLVWWANPETYTYGITSDAHGGTTHTTDSDTADYLKDMVIEDWVGFRGALSDFVNNSWLPADCGQAVRMAKVFIKAAVIGLSLYTSADSVLGATLGALVTGLLDYLIPAIIICLVVLVAVIFIKNCKWSYS